MGKDKGVDEEYMAAVQAAVVKPDSCAEGFDVHEAMAKMQECMPKEGKDGKKDMNQDKNAEESEMTQSVRKGEDMEMELSEEAQAEMMACFVPEDASDETFTCFTEMHTAIMDAKAAVKAAYEEAMNAEVMAMWPECAAD